MHPLVGQKWFKLCTVIILFKCQKIPIPTSVKNERNSDGHDSFDEDEEEEELMELTKVPKLHLRPKTAPSIEGRRGVRYVTWNEAQQQNGPKRPSSASKPTKHQRDLWTRVRNFLNIITNTGFFHVLPLSCSSEQKKYSLIYFNMISSRIPCQGAFI